MAPLCVCRCHPPTPPPYLAVRVALCCCSRCLAIGQEEEYKDATLIMQLIRDNLTLWTSDAADDGKPTDDGTNIEDLES